MKQTNVSTAWQMTSPLLVLLPSSTQLDLEDVSSPISRKPSELPRMKSRDSHGDAALQELEGALDAFIATHLTTVASIVSAKKVDYWLDPFATDDAIATNTTTVRRDLKRLQCRIAVITTTRRRRGPASVASVAKLLLSWLQSVESSSAAATSVVPPSAAKAARTANQQSPLDPVASWVAAKLLTVVFHVPLTTPTSGDGSVECSIIDELVALVVSRCLVAIQQSWLAEQETYRRARAECSRTLFSYLTMQKATLKTSSRSKPSNAQSVCLTCTTEASVIWANVLGRVACWSPHIARPMLQTEIRMRAVAWNATKLSGTSVRHPYLKHMAELRLGLASYHTAPSLLTLSFRLSDAAQWLRVVMPLLLKPHRLHVRSACAHLIAHLLQRELELLGRQELHVLYTCNGRDWSRCISDLHAAAFRLTACAKKKRRGRTQQQLEASSWALRAVVLALAPGEIFTRYWRDDVLALLRLQYHLNQNSSRTRVALYTVLPSLDLSFTYLLHRHVVVQSLGPGTAGALSDSECMEIITTTQAWAFFSLPRLRPQSSSGSGSSDFTALQTIAVPALVHVTRVMAAYNLTYTVQSHLCRLLAESVGVGDPLKLVGLEALAELLQPHNDDEDSLATFQVNHNDLLACQQVLGELVGRVLLECSTRLGQQVLTEIPLMVNPTDELQMMNKQDKDDDELWKHPTHAVAVATFAAALALIPILFAQIPLSLEQKVALLVQSTLNTEKVVRRCAQESILSLVGPQAPSHLKPFTCGAGTVIRALTDAIMHMNESPSTTVRSAAGAIMILQALNALLAPSRVALTRWASSHAPVEALIHVEAIAVYLLARGDDDLHAEQMLQLAVFETLKAAHEARLTFCKHFVGANADQQPFDRPSVWTLVHELDFELQTAFFTYKARETTPGDHAFALRRLLFDTSKRHSFQWSVALARILTCVAKHAPEVTAYIWADVADQVTKIEPVLSVTLRTDKSVYNQRELGRWRNLALLSMIAAAPRLQQQVVSVTEQSFSLASPTIVTALVRHLACYLRSTNIGQCHAAILGLGHAGAVALTTLLDVLARLQLEAFSLPCKDEQALLDKDARPLKATRPRRIRATKLSKNKALDVQHARVAKLTLQWAIGRCYRLIMESRTREEIKKDDLTPGVFMAKRLCCAVSTYLTQIVATLENTLSSYFESREGAVSRSCVSDNNPMLFMMQLDFMATYQSLLHYVSVSHESIQHLSMDHIATMVLGWCGDFDKDLAHNSLIGHFRSGFVACDKALYSHWMQLCDVSTASDGAVFYPCLWVENQPTLLHQSDTSRRVAQYLICHRAFSTVADILRYSLETRESDKKEDDDSIVTWLDACFHIDGAHFDHFQDLHYFGQRALHALLDLPVASAQFYHVMRRCLEKATYALTRAADAELRVARQYLAALGASTNVISFFRSCLHQLQLERGAVQDRENLALVVLLVHVLLLHVGTRPPDERCLQVALSIVAALVSTSSDDGNDDESAAIRWSLQGYDSSRVESHVATRLPVTVSALLASHFPVLSLRVSLALLRSLPTLPLHERLEITQQQQMLAAVLPWLAEVSLLTIRESPCRPYELLDVLYQLTAIHRDTCREQLEHSWLTLAFASHDGDDDTNVQEIVTFLYQQQLKGHMPKDTAQTITGWLCRWQDAASEVLRYLLLQPSMTAADVSPDTTAIYKLAALVTLTSDTSCHLLPCASSTDVQALALHLMHVALTTLFAVQESPSVDDHRTSDIRHHCHVLLHSISPHLKAPRRLVVEALNSLRAATLSLKLDDKRNFRAVFTEAIRALTECLSTRERQTWSELCVQEIARAILPDSLQPFKGVEGLRRPSQVCVCFALEAYTQLSPCFQGDVLLSVLALLRQTLTGVGVDDSQTLSLGRDCLALIAMLMRTMPDSKLVLYPQVFWVAHALLTHCHQQRDNPSRPRSSLHVGALELLATIWTRTPFLRHPVVHDVIRATRPAQWGTVHTSVVMEIVRCMYADDSSASRAHARTMMQQAVLFVPCDLLGVSSRQHLVICTLSLFPALTIGSSKEDNEGWKVLAILWQRCKSGSKVHMVKLLQAQEQESSLEVVSAFMTVFVAALDELERDEHGDKTFDGFDLSLEVLLACLPSPPTKPQMNALETSSTLNDRRCDVVFLLLGQLLREVLSRIETMKRKWRPFPELEATLARLLRCPRSEQQWRLAVQVLTWVAEVSKATGSAVPVLPNCSVPSHKSSELPGALTEPSDTGTPVETELMKK